MKKYFRNVGLVASLLPLFIGQPVLAHVIWFEEGANNRYELLFGHPEIPEIEPLVPSKFKEATAYDSDRNIVPSTTLFQGNDLFIVPEDEIAALTAFYDNGFWVQRSDGSSENISAEEAEAINYENVSNFVKYTKAIYDWSPSTSTPFDLPLEIIPLQNPLTVNAGDFLPIQVLLSGNLLTNPVVEYLGQIVTVGNDGIALVPVGKGGLQVIEASYNDPNTIDPAISYATTLSVAQTTPEPSALLALGAIGLMSFTKKRHKQNSIR